MQNHTIPWWEVVYKLILSVFTGLLLAGLIGLILEKTGLIQSFLTPSDDDLHSLRWALAINQIGTFIFPSIFFVLLIRQGPFADFFRLRSSPSINSILLATAAIVVGFIFIQYAYEWNRQWPMPQWMMDAEEASQQKIETLLSGDQWRDLFINLVLIAVIPAIGEELIFRGILQKYLIIWTRSPWIGIVLGGLIFSAIHVQFQGFIPRMLLGCLLGYYFWVSGNLWLPIIAHFFNNGFQVFIQFLFVKKISDLDLETDVSILWYFALASLILSFLLCSILWKISKKTNTEENLP